MALPSLPKTLSSMDDVEPADILPRLASYRSSDRGYLAQSRFQDDTMEAEPMKAGDGADLGIHFRAM
jgi:hypothetical protein